MISSLQFQIFLRWESHILKYAYTQITVPTFRSFPTNGVKPAASEIFITEMHDWWHKNYFIKYYTSHIQLLTKVNDLYKNINYLY